MKLYLTQLVAASSWSNAALSLSVYLHYWSLFQLMCSVPPDLNYRFCYDCFTSKIVFKKPIKSWINYITLSFWCKYDCLILHPLMKFMQRMKYLQFFIKLRNFLLPCICCLFRGKNPSVYVLVLYGKNFDVTRPNYAYIQMELTGWMSFFLFVVSLFFSILISRAYTDARLVKQIIAN